MDVDVIALDRALEELAAIDPQQARVVELRFFGGLTVEETAEVLGTSAGTRQARMEYGASVAAPRGGG